jgi:WD40 repeat protein
LPSGSPSSSALKVSEIARIRGHSASITTLRPNLGWTRIATGSSDGLVCLWDTSDMSCTGVLDRADGQVRSISWSGSGTHLAASHGDTNDLHKYLDVCRADGTLIKRIVSPVSINHVAWCPIAPLIAYSLDDTAGAAVAASIVSAAGGEGGGGRFGGGGYGGRGAAAGPPPPNTKDFAIKILAA